MWASRWATRWGGTTRVVVTCWNPQAKLKTLRAGVPKSPSLNSWVQVSVAYQTHFRALFLHSQFFHYLCFGENWIFLDCTKTLLFSDPWLFPFLSEEQRGLLLPGWPRGEALLGLLPCTHPGSALYKTHTRTIPLNTRLIFMTYSK